MVGADSLIGAGLVALLGQMGANVTGTTRRKARVSSNCVFLDLASEEASELVEGRYACAFLCAGATAMSACESEPERTCRINVTNTVRLSKRIRAAGTRIVFLSSNAVFDGRSARPDENADYCACTEYGRQKAAAERELTGLRGDAGSVAIARLSKVLSPGSGVAAAFMGKLGNGEPCSAFDDLSMSPISLEYVIDALARIAFSGLSGVFHLSGAEEMDYAELARRLAARIGVDPGLVRPCRSTAAGMNVLFRPEHPALGMKRTRELLGIEPEPTAHLLDMLVRRRA